MKKLILFLYNVDGNSKLALYLNRKYLNNEDYDFLERFVISDVTDFVETISRDDNKVGRVLLFPPLRKKYRYLLHTFIEENFANLFTFSVCDEGNRRTVVCDKAHVLRCIKSGRCINENVLEWAHKKNLIHRPMKKEPNKKIMESVEPKKNVLPPSENSKLSKKTRRPDMQLYVPRGRRSDTSSGDELTQSNERLHLASSPQNVQGALENVVRRTVRGNAPQNERCKNLPDVVPVEVSKETFSRGKITKMIPTTNLQKPVLRNHVAACAKKTSGETSTYRAQIQTTVEKNVKSWEYGKMPAKGTNLREDVFPNRTNQKNQCEDSVSNSVAQNKSAIDFYRNEESKLPSVDATSICREDHVQSLTACEKLTETSYNYDSNVNSLSEIPRHAHESCEAISVAEIVSWDNHIVDTKFSENVIFQEDNESEEFVDAVFSLETSISEDTYNNPCINDLEPSRSGTDRKLPQETFNRELNLAKGSETHFCDKGINASMSKHSEENDVNASFKNADGKILEEINHLTTRTTFTSNSDNRQILQDIEKSERKCRGNCDLIANASAPESVQRKEKNAQHGKTEDDNWDSLFDENGDCVNPEVLTELTDTLGKVSIQKSKYDYLDFRPHDPDISGEEFSHIVELYDFPAEFKTQDLMAILSSFKERGFNIKWIDDTHALAVFSSSIAATEALSIHHPLVKVRPLSQAISVSKWKAKRYSDDLLPYKPRPQTTASLARRLVSGALGLRIAIPKEQRDQERQRLQQAKERKRQVAKQKQDVWDGVVS